MDMHLNALKKPVIHLYTICWNEEYMLKYFFKYYDTFVDRYVFFDDGSTDQTLNILTNHPRVEIRRFEQKNVDSKVLSGRYLHNTAWKESRGEANWVISTSVDEFLYTPDMLSYLAKSASEGVTAIPALGFQMISETLPASNRNLLDIVKRGCPWTRMNKLSIFNPNKIAEINQQVGRHRARPVGEVRYPARDELLLLHYRYLSFEYTFHRNIELQNKLGPMDKAKNWAHKYSWTRDQLKNDWDHFMQNSVEDVFSPEYNPHLMHSPLSERWWREDSSLNQNNT
jgi:hypothetical protein